MKSKRQAHPRPILINPVSSNQNKSRKKKKRAPFPANPHWFISLETNKQAESAPHRSKQAHSSSSWNLLSGVLSGAGRASPPPCSHGGRSWKQGHWRRYRPWACGAWPSGALSCWRLLGRRGTLAPAPSPIASFLSSCQIYDVSITQKRTCNRTPLTI